MLELYSATYCPHCRKVETFFDENKIAYEKQDVGMDPGARDVVLEKGGKMQIPFLLDTETNVSMYESDDIIAYATEKYADAS